MGGPCRAADQGNVNDHARDTNCEPRDKRRESVAGNCVSVRSAVARVGPLDMVANGSLIRRFNPRQAAARRPLHSVLTGSRAIMSSGQTSRPTCSARVGNRPVVDARDARRLFDSIDVTIPIGLRERALIALTVNSRASASHWRFGRGSVRNRESGRKPNRRPCPRETSPLQEEQFGL